MVLTERKLLPNYSISTSSVSVRIFVIVRWQPLLTMKPPAPLSVSVSGDSTLLCREALSRQADVTAVTSDCTTVPLSLDIIVMRHTTHLLTINKY